MAAHAGACSGSAPSGSPTVRCAGGASPSSCTSRRRPRASCSRCGRPAPQVVAAGSNPLSTQDAVCAALVERGVAVLARHGVSPDEFTADLLAVAETQPELVIDDGLELTRRIAQHRPEVYERLLGVSEETTTGVARLRALEAEGRLPFPAIAANDARCKHMFDNPYGTGQATLTAMLALTNVLAAGREFCVVGYGWVGKGVAKRGRRARRPRHRRRDRPGARADGAHGRLPRRRARGRAARRGRRDHGDRRWSRRCPRRRSRYLKDGVVLANAGHHDREIDVPALAAAAEQVDRRAPGRAHLRRRRTTRARARRRRARQHRRARRQSDRDHGPLVLGSGARRFTTSRRRRCPPGLHRFPDELDDLIARTKLATLGISLDAASEAQRRFKASWQ